MICPVDPQKVQIPFLSRLPQLVKMRTNRHTISRGRKMIQEEEKKQVCCIRGCLDKRKKLCGFSTCVSTEFFFLFLWKKKSLSNEIPFVITLGSI
jgi:hypothetical protein